MCDCNINPCACGTSPKGNTGASSYLFVGYALNDAGAGFSFTPTDLLKYRAELVKASTTPPIAADFAGKWVKYLGDNGAPGLPGGPGTNGVNGTTVLYVDGTVIRTDANTSEKTLKIYTIPGATMVANGDGIEAEIEGSIGLVNTDATFKLYFGSALLSTIAVNDSAQNHYFYSIKVAKIDVGIQKVSVAIRKSVPGGGSPISLSERLISYGEDETLPIVLKLTGQNGADALDNTIRASFMWVKKYKV